MDTVIGTDYSRRDVQEHTGIRITECLCVLIQTLWKLHFLFEEFPANLFELSCVIKV